MITATTDRARALRRAAVRAVRAPSVHNTQPWRFVQLDGALEIEADWSRRLQVLDPTGRQLMISCGCAVFNARVALADAGIASGVERFPDPTRPDLVARLVADGTSLAAPDADTIAHLEPAIETRQSNRRPFVDDRVPTEMIETLVEAAHAEGAQLLAIRRPEDRAALARLTQLADRIETSEPAYRAELRRWTTSDHRRLDGVPSTAVPSVDGTTQDAIPIRDFDTRGDGRLPAATRSDEECLLLLGTNADNPVAWARAGEALERVWLEIAARGYTANLFTQLIEVPRTRGMLRAELALSMQPHVLLRVGRAASTASTRRRRLVDVLVDASSTTS